MIIKVDTQEMNNPNEFGETLRKYCFVGPGYGCYSTFNLRLGFARIQPDDERWQTIVNYLACPIELLDRLEIFSNGNITLGWFWDGDGVLVIQEGTQIAYNGDCKKDYTWNWIDPDTGELI